MNIPSDITFDRVFYVIDEQAPNASPGLAICPRIYENEKGEKHISWRNTGRGLDFVYKAIDYGTADETHPPKEIKVTAGNKGYTLQELTCEVYYQKMKNIYNKPKFENDESLQTYYKEYNPDYESYKGMFG